MTVSRRSFMLIIAALQLNLSLICRHLSSYTQNIQRIYQLMISEKVFKKITIGKKFKRKRKPRRFWIRPWRTQRWWHSFVNNVAGSLQANPSLLSSFGYLWRNISLMSEYFVLMDSQSNPFPACSDLKWSITSSNSCNSSSIQLKLLAFTAFCSSDALFFMSSI